MPNDAKLGMAAGVGLIILVAVLFFRKDAPSASTATEGTRAVTPTPAAKRIRGPTTSTVTPLRSISLDTQGPSEQSARKPEPGGSKGTFP